MRHRLEFYRIVHCNMPAEATTAGREDAGVAASAGGPSAGACKSLVPLARMLYAGRWPFAQDGRKAVFAIGALASSRRGEGRGRAVRRAGDRAQVAGPVGG